MDVEKIAERWEYISGGFYYIDQSHSVDAPSTRELAAGELRAFLLSLPDGTPAQKEQILAVLHLETEPVAFSHLPRSFEIMLETDTAYLRTAPDTPLNSQFGSVAMVLLYQEIAALLSAGTSVPDAMIKRIVEVAGKQPILQESENMPSQDIGEELSYATGT